MQNPEGQIFYRYIGKLLRRIKALVQSVGIYLLYFVDQSQENNMTRQHLKNLQLKIKQGFAGCCSKFRLLYPLFVYFFQEEKYENTLFYRLIPARKYTLFYFFRSYK